MATWNIAELVDPKKVWSNMHFIVAGMIGGVIVYQLWISKFVAPAQSIGVRSPTAGEPVYGLQPGPTHPSVPVYAYGPQPGETNTYGCTNCGGLAATSPTETRPRVY